MPLYDRRAGIFRRRRIQIGKIKRVGGRLRIICCVTCTEKKKKGEKMSGQHHIAVGTLSRAVTFVHVRIIIKTYIILPIHVY